MKEKVKEFWKDNKETIKTYTILVMAPIAVAGIVALKSLDNMTTTIRIAAEDKYDKKKEA